MKKPFGVPRCRWEDNTNMYLKTTMDATGIFPDWGEGGEDEIRTFPYKLTFKLFKTICIDRPRIFRIEEQLKRKLIFCINIWRISFFFFNSDFFLSCHPTLWQRPWNTDELLGLKRTHNFFTSETIISFTWRIPQHWVKISISISEDIILIYCSENFISHNTYSSTSLWIMFLCS
jgi:hypothetical protein